MTVSLRKLSDITVSYDDLPFLKYRSYDKEKNIKVYCIDAEKLNAAECHMFFPKALSEEMLVITALEFFTMLPRTPLNEKFHVSMINCKGIKLWWCSFPRAFKEQCERAAEVFGLQMKIMPRVMVKPFASAEKVSSKKHPALTLADDYKQRRIFDEPPAEEAPVKKDALVLRKKEPKRPPGTALEFPKKDNILFFQGERDMSDAAVKKRHADIIKIGKDLHKLGVD